MKKLASGIFILAVVLSACVSGRPDWTSSGKSRSYPDASYLVGTGVGDELETAKDRARANLAKIFEVRISEVTEDVVKHRSATSKGRTENVNEARVERIISSRTKQIIRGVKLAETWKDRDSKMFYALAVLPRQQAANSLREEIDRLDKATETYLWRARRESDILIKIRAASQALDAQVARRAYQRPLKIVDRSGRGKAPRWNAAKLSDDLDKLLKRVRVAPEVSVDPSGTLRTSLAGALAKAGFMADTGKEPEFILEASLEWDDIGYRDNWFWMRGVLKVTMKERFNERVRGSVQWAIKAAGQETVVAKRRISKKVDAILKKELRTAIITFATR